MESYQDLLRHVIETCDFRENRTGVKAWSVFGAQIECGLRFGTVPLLTTKAVHWHSVVEELLWMLRGETNVFPLQARGVRIWNEWADKNGDLGPVYGEQWRQWHKPDGQPIDQIANVIKSIKADPFGRRHIVSAWNVADLDEMALPPCHAMFQFYVGTAYGEPRLSCHLYQRSADIFLGVPFNLASYGLLTHIIAKACGMKADRLVVSYGDLHLYENHYDQAVEQLGRKPRTPPFVVINGAGDEWNTGTLAGLENKHITLECYNPHPAIKAEVAV